ncbi:hypothetical protein QMK19_12000 [Streptomyces sp. H10-C2]|uniref:hypothetical protein n=1 Tax=unclassified Streptomyces TaxID=2593676 RepID=UPI0024BB033D|nr:MULTISPECIES: hypothetical protein [unclassified Streptomyces]MDJ0341865.1 hypothetical protein [Streptomyces sp. PH10-H1]MDJ0370381.1 hypothetical protein [Streptomyces sp. H10-C2]
MRTHQTGTGRLDALHRLDAERYERRAVHHVPVLGDLAVLQTEEFGGVQRRLRTVPGAAPPAHEEHDAVVVRHQVLHGHGQALELGRDHPPEAHQPTGQGLDQRIVLDMVGTDPLRGLVEQLRGQDLLEQLPHYVGVLHSCRRGADDVSGRHDSSAP